jgi:hypothetical protein
MRHAIVKQHKTFHSNRKDTFSDKFHSLLVMLWKKLAMYLFCVEVPYPIQSTENLSFFLSRPFRAFYISALNVWHHPDAHQI